MNTASRSTLRRWIVTGLLAASCVATSMPVSAQNQAGSAAELVAAPPRREPAVSAPRASGDIAVGPGAGASTSSAARMVRAPVPPTGSTVSGVTRPHVAVVTPPPPPSRIRILASLGRVEGLLGRAPAQQAMPRIEVLASQCYTNALTANPSVQGLMVLRLTVLPTGTIGDVEEAANYVRDANLSACLSASVRTARFPGFTGTAPSVAMIQLRFIQH